MNKSTTKITPQSKDFAQWYSDVILNAKMIQYGPVKGTIFFMPNSYSIWENIQNYLNSNFYSKGIKNVYLPVFMPEKLLDLEKKHIEGFAPELLKITSVGNRKLKENLVIRPTSEVLFCQLFKNAIDSYNDLPIMLNQWCSVVRWEKNTKPFLRTSEFLWQEGHTIHKDYAEADDFAKEIIFLYKKFVEDILAIPTLCGQKSELEKFPGASSTYTIEAILPDGQCLQSATSHNLSTHFSNVFDVKYRDKNNKFSNPFQTSFGISSRIIGAIIMAHGDDLGLVLPPKISPIKVQICTLFGDKNKDVINKAYDIQKLLSDNGIKSDIDNTSKGIGYKANNWEKIGIPIRFDIGPNDVKNKTYFVTKRNTLKKIIIKENNIQQSINNLLMEIQSEMLSKSSNIFYSKIIEGKSLDDFKYAINNNKVIYIPFNLSKENESKIKRDFQVVTRCIKSVASENDVCFYTNKKATHIVYFGRAY